MAFVDRLAVSIGNTCFRLLATNVARASPTSVSMTTRTRYTHSDGYRYLSIGRITSMSYNSSATTPASGSPDPAISVKSAKDVFDGFKRTFNRRINAGLVKTLAPVRAALSTNGELTPSIALRRGVTLIGRKCRQGFTMCTKSLHLALTADTPTGGSGVSRARQIDVRHSFLEQGKSAENTEILRPASQTHVSKQEFSASSAAFTTMSRPSLASLTESLVAETGRIIDATGDLLRRKWRPDVVNEQDYWRAMGFGPKGPDSK